MSFEQGVRGFSEDLINIYWGIFTNYLLDVYHFLGVQIIFDDMYLSAGLYYDGINNEIGTEMSMLEANKINQEMAVAAAHARRDQEMLAKEKSVTSQPLESTELDGIQEETADADIPVVGETTSKGWLLGVIFPL